MKANVTIKALSAAVLGLAGMAFAGSSFAVCPTGTTNDDPSVNWPGGKILVGGAVLGLQGPGMKSSPCLMTSNLSANSTAAAIVRDNTPANETRYRFRFYLNADNLTTFSGSQQVQIFAANANAAATTFGGASTPNILRASLVPGTGGVKRVNFVASSGTTSQPATGINLVAGPNVIEGEIIIGAVGTGKVNLWVNNNVEATPSATITNIDNTAWVGVKFALLGLTNGSSAFRTNSAGQNVLFDEFDSRRTTFIGQ